MKPRTFLPLAALALLAVLPAQAKLPFVKKAQALGFAEVKDCMSCHTTKMPKKGEALAERGQFLMDQKKAHKAEEVDLAWLKDYKPKK